MEDFEYKPAEDLEYDLAQRLKHFPREPRISDYALRSISSFVLRSWLKVFHRLRVQGRENLPKDRSCVLVANHASHLDALCLLSSLPFKRIHHAFPAAAADYFFSSFPRSFFSSIFINAMPFDRLVNGAESLEMCRKLLSEPGNILILFPEGTRSVDGQIGRFKSGIARLTAGTTIPVVPCYLHGCYEAFPKGGLLPRLKPLRVMIGKPMTFQDSTQDKTGSQEICSALEKAVKSLKPQ